MSASPITVCSLLLLAAALATGSTFEHAFRHCYSSRARGQPFKLRLGQHRCVTHCTAPQFDLDLSVVVRMELVCSAVTSTDDFCYDLHGAVEIDEFRYCDVIHCPEVVGDDEKSRVRLLCHSIPRE